MDRVQTRDKGLRASGCRKPKLGWGGQAINCTPGTVCGDSPALTHLILAMTVGAEHDYPHFIDEKMEAERG